MGLKVLSSDRIFEIMLDKNGISKDLANLSPEDFLKATVGKDSLREKAKNLTNELTTHYLAGRLGMIIDTSGRHYDKVTNLSTELKELGYDVYLIFVDTSFDKALERNNKRDRKLPEDVVKDVWENAEKNKESFEQYFGSNMIVIQNDIDRKNGEYIDIDPQLMKTARRFVQSPVKNSIGVKWIKDMKEAKNKLKLEKV
jgi:predicted kinase